MYYLDLGFGVWGIGCSRLTSTCGARGVVASSELGRLHTCLSVAYQLHTRTPQGVVASSELGLRMGLGHCHEGVTEAMAAIESAGYRLLFLTARCLSMQLV